MIAFEEQRIEILTKKRGEWPPRRNMIDVIVGVGTGLGYHLPIPGTVLHQRFPDSWVICSLPYGRPMVGSPLPTNEATAQALIAYLFAHKDSSKDADQLAEECASCGGRWIWLPRKTEP